MIEGLEVIGYCKKDSKTHYSLWENIINAYI